MSHYFQGITVIKTVILRHDLTVLLDKNFHVGMFNGNTNVTLKGVLGRTQYRVSKDAYNALDIISQESIAENVDLAFLDLSSLDFGNPVHVETIHKHVLGSYTKIGKHIYSVALCPKETAPTLCITNLFPDNTRNYLVFSESIIVEREEPDRILFSVKHNEGAVREISTFSLDDNQSISGNMVGVFCLKKELV